MVCKENRDGNDVGNVCYTFPRKPPDSNVSQSNNPKGNPPSQRETICRQCAWK